MKELLEIALGVGIAFIGFTVWALFRASGAVSEWERRHGIDS